MYEVHRGVSSEVTIFQLYIVDLHDKENEARSISAQDVTGLSWVLFVCVLAQDEYNLEYLQRNLVYVDDTGRDAIKYS
jgi:hypothetical protein